MIPPIEDDYDPIEEARNILGLPTDRSEFDIESELGVTWNEYEAARDIPNSTGGMDLPAFFVFYQSNGLAATQMACFMWGGLAICFAIVVAILLLHGG